MKSIYAGANKITNAAGRSDYISNPNRQEHLVLTNSMMEYSWKQHAAFEKEHKKTNKENNEALEVQINLPNELKDNLEAIKEICDELAARIVGQGHDMEYGVHWNKSEKSLHCHLLFSERENATELVPKLYKRDIWYDKNTHRMAKAGAENAELIHRKGEIQRDEDNGETFVIRPPYPLNIGTVESDKDEIKRVYEVGCEEGKKILPGLVEYLKD